MSIDTKDTRKGLEQAEALRDAAGDKYRSDGSGACPECGAWRPSDTHRERWDHEDDCPWVARNANKALLAQCAPDIVTLATAIAAERDTAEAEVERLREQVQTMLADASEWSARFDRELGRMRTRLAEVEAERDRLHGALTRWGRWRHSPDGMGGDLFDAAVEGTPADCFPAEVPR